MKIQKEDRLKTIYMQSVLKPPYTNWSFIHRFWVFQSERIPLFVMVVLAVFLTTAVAKASDNLIWTRTAIASLIAVLYLLQIRLSDEPKDYEHDNKYYPQRPVQRGVVTLRELLYLKNAVVVSFFIVAAVAAITVSWEILFLACLQQGYSFLTRKEFFVRDWLRAHFLLYQFSHYAQLLILDWLILTILNIQPISEKLMYFIFVILMISMVEGARTIGGIDRQKAKDRYSNRLGVNQALSWFVTLTAASVGYTIFLILRFNGSIHWTILIIAVIIVGSLIVKYRQNPKEKQAQLLQGGALLMLLGTTATLFLSK